MLSTKEPISKIITLALKEELPIESKIQREAQNLSDLIHARIQLQSIDEVATGLVPDIFDFRILVLKLMKEKTLDFDQYFKALDKEIALRLQLAEFSNLNRILSRVHLFYSEIFASILQKQNISSVHQLEETTPEMTYEELNYFIEKTLPIIPGNKYLKKWIQESLKLEVGLFLSNKILSERSQLNKEKIHLELISFFRKTIVRYGAYSIVLNVWRPKSYQDDSIANDMETLAATIRIENGIYKKMNLSDLSNLIEN